MEILLKIIAIVLLIASVFLIGITSIYNGVGTKSSKDYVFTIVIYIVAILSVSYLLL